MERLRLGSELKNLRRLRRWVARLCAAWGMDDEGIDDLRVAVGEAFTNCVVHAYGGRPDGRITITAERADGRVEIRIRDAGESSPVDPDAVPDLTVAHEGGYGVYLMKRLTDGLRFVITDPPGTEVLLVKNLPRTAGKS